MPGSRAICAFSSPASTRPDITDALAWSDPNVFTEDVIGQIADLRRYAFEEQDAVILEASKRK
jgi:hypothetical protein